MKNYQKRNNFMHFLQSWPVLCLLAILVFFTAFGVIRLYGGLRDTINNKRIAEAKVQELTSRKEKLTNDIKNLETDAGKEKIFRENYGLAKEGEGVIMVMDEKTDTSKDTKTSKGGFFGFLKNIFR